MFDDFHNLQQPADWEPRTWPWPPEKGLRPPKTDLELCELGNRAVSLIGREGIYHRNVDYDIICRMLVIQDTAVTLWWRSRRISVVVNNVLAVEFGPTGLMYYGNLDSIRCALAKLRQHMVLDDLASI